MRPGWGCPPPPLPLFCAPVLGCWTSGPVPIRLENGAIAWPLYRFRGIAWTCSCVPDTVFCCCCGFYSDSQSSGTLSREQSESFLGQASAFLTTCAPEQIRLAADKCKFEPYFDCSCLFGCMVLLYHGRIEW